MSRATKASWALFIEGEEAIRAWYVPDARRTLPQRFEERSRALISAALDQARPRYDVEPFVAVGYMVTCNGAEVLRSGARRPFTGPVEKSRPRG